VIRGRDVMNSEGRVAVMVGGGGIGASVTMAGRVESVMT
jgi:hypothetical protein